MKLNYWRTICIGFAFFLICAFWQAYDSIIPKILTDKFGMSQAGSGIVMALDNIFALFLLPLFGALSDKCASKYGRRTPFIFVGTIIAVAAFFCLTFADNAQLKNIESVAANDSSTLKILYEDESVSSAALMTPDGDKFVLRDSFTFEEFTSITVDSQEPDSDNMWSSYVVPARQAYVAKLTDAKQLNMWFFIGILLVTLIAMAIFRSPAVALMPDATVKPLRSKANAIINLMGAFGGLIVLGLGLALGTGKPQNALMSYTAYFGIIGVIMIAALIAFLLTVKEPKFVAEMEEESRKHGIDNTQCAVADKERRRLSKPELISLLMILASVCLWYFGYNAVTSKYSVYAGKVLGLDYNLTLMVAQAAAIISYLPVGILSSKIGRKKAILIGVVMLAAAFFIASFLRQGSSALLMNCMFALAGIGWATINVNSFPMVVELAKAGNVGKYTGYYYAASMSAQALTPFISGLFMDKLGLRALFPYATVFVALAFLTMLLVKHGDNKPVAKIGLEALDIDD